MTAPSRPPSDPRTEVWPALPLEAWQDTAATLHLWTQIVGKVRLAQTPWINHSWHVTLYVTPRGLSTSPVPHGTREFAIDFDFVDHRLLVHSSDGRTGGFPLTAMTVAMFYRFLMEELERLGLRVAIVRRPWEIPAPIRCDRDETLLAFLQSTYEIAANLGHWDRPALERRSDPGKGERSSEKTGGLAGRRGRRHVRCCRLRPCARSSTAACSP